MELVNIRDLYRRKEEYLEKDISIGGWVRSIRSSKAFGFIVVNDGTFFEPLQVVYHDALPNFEAVENWWQLLRQNSPLRFRRMKW